MRIVALILLVLSTSACSSMNTIETANTIKILGSISKAGINEEAANCVKDIFDPHNRGGC